jgi:hypothetical protein
VSPRVPQLQTCLPVQEGFGVATCHQAHCPLEKGSGVTTCPTAPDPPPGAGGLWCRHVPLGPLPGREGLQRHHVLSGPPPSREGLHRHHVSCDSRPASRCGRILASPRVPWLLASEASLRIPKALDIRLVMASPGKRSRQGIKYIQDKPYAA